MTSQALRTADTQSRRAALTLALCLPSDVLLYLLLPMESQAFGITLAQAALLLIRVQSWFAVCWTKALKYAL